MSDAGSMPSIFLVGVAASVIGAMVGGGSLLSIPFLIFFGLPAQVAIATDRFAGLGAAVTAFYRFARAGRIVWRYVPALALASLAGSLIGARLLVEAPPESLDLVVGVLLLVLLPLLFLKRDLGIAAREVGRLRLGLGLGLYFLVQVLAVFAGDGIVDFRSGVVLMAGNAVGGDLGAHVAVRSGDRWVRRLFGVVVLASAARLLFG